MWTRNMASVHIRTTPALRRRIEALAEARGSSLTGAITAAVMEATAPMDRGGVPDEAEVLNLLGEAARAGSVPAMRELLRYYRERDGSDADEAEGGPLAAVH